MSAGVENRKTRAQIMEKAKKFCWGENENHI